MELKIKKLCGRSVLPTYAHPQEDACFDIRVLIDDATNEPFRFVGGERNVMPDRDLFEDADGHICAVYIRPGESVVFHTGLSFDIPKGHSIKVYARSSTGIKNHLMLSNGTGIIDPGYKGELHVSLTNFGSEDVIVRDGDRVAQAEVCRIESVEIVEVDELSESARGADGLGSSGR